MKCHYSLFANKIDSVLIRAKLILVIWWSMAKDEYRVRPILYSANHTIKPYLIDFDVLLMI